MENRYVPLALALLLPLALPVRADACSCAPGPHPPCQAAWSADAVFVATVVDVIDVPPGRDTFMRSRLVRLRVREAFLGGLGEEVDVFTGRGGGDCGFPFSKNRDYLIYAHRVAGSNVLTTGICSRTRQMNAGEDLGYLRAPDRPETRIGTLRGEVVRRDPGPEGRYVRAPVAGARLIATAGAAEFSATTDRDGRYELELPAGRYALRLEGPPGVSARPAFPRTLISNGRGCSRLDVQFEWDGRIAGRVRDARGQPVAGIALRVSSAADYRLIPEPLARTGDDGRYEFTHLPPGTFHVRLIGGRTSGDAGGDPDGLLLRGPDGLPLPLDVGSGDRTTAADFVVSDRVRVVTLAGVVLAPDGTPAAEASIHVFTAEARAREQIGPTIRTGLDGRFSVSIVAGYRYQLSADGYEDGRYVSRADPLVIDATAGIAPVTLRLQPLSSTGNSGRL